MYSAKLSLKSKVVATKNKPFLKILHNTVWQIVEFDKVVKFHSTSLRRLSNSTTFFIYIAPGNFIGVPASS